ncbi:MAG TPA: hypothetical protein VH087_03805 [Thermoanaerobaculia bacterium]|nr:hypothetical protein [Thermoanaerobaculia bacterium]
MDVFPDTPPKMAAVYAAPENFKLKTLPKTAVKEGTLFILPNITGIVKQAAADPLDSIVVYSSAASGGKPNEISLRFLAGDKQPKFVEPSIEAKVK